MIRHGERADKVDHQKLGIKVEEQLDPPLTPQGIRQAEETGHFLNSFLAKNKYTDVVIESSPFLRTLQTASVTASILKID